MGENWLDDYRAEKAAYMREYRAANPDRRARERRANNARGRAYARLAQMYPDDARRLWLEELAKDPA